MAVGLSPEFTSAYMQAQQGGPFVDRALPGGPMVSPVLPPNYTPSMFPPMKLQPTSYSAQTRYYSPAASSGFDQRDINNMSYDQLVRGARTGGLIYNDPNASQQGMFQPMFPTQFNPYQSMYGGVSYPQFNMGYNPYIGMFSGYGMPTQQPQQQEDLYALPTQPFQNPFGGYTDYTGVNQQFIDARRNLIDALASQAGMSPEQAVRAADNSTLLNNLVNSMGGRRYGESTASTSETTGGYGS